MAELKSNSLKMLCTGFALGVANDLHPEGKFNFLKNVRVLKEGVIEGRPSIEDFLTLNPDPNDIPHCIKTIINKSNNSFLRIVGAGTKLFTGNGAILPEKASGFSGKPLFMIDFRPEQAIEAYLYIADENKFVKISVSDSLSDVGINVPTKAAIWGAVKPEKKIIDLIDAGSDADWNNLTGSAGAPTVESRVNTTVTAFLADGALPNFASIMPADMHNINKGSIVTINGVQSIIEEIIPSSLNVGIATIAKISYDFGVSGACTIVLSVSSVDIKRNSILLLDGVEYVRVEDVTRDSNNIPSIKTTTIGTFAIGDSVSGADTFRIYTSVAFAPAQTIVNSTIKTVIGAAGISSITRIFDVDLTNTGTKPLTDDDIFHISILADPSKITEIQVQLDVDSTNNNFTENYYYYPIGPNFFTASVTQTTPTLSVIQQTIQRQQLLDQAQNIYEHILRNAESGGYYPGTDVEEIYNQLVYQAGIETVTGLLQYTELDIRLGDFNRVGADASRTKKDIKAIRISINATAAIDIYIDSLWVGGSGALDSMSNTGFLPYNYVWRVRDPATKATSNWSPPLRTGIRISRSGIALSFPDANINYPNTYKIDVARFGGSLTDFRIVGSILNDGSQFIDTSSDRIIADNPLAGRFPDSNSDAIFDFYKPFAILDTPKTGTCNVIGTKLTRTAGDILNITYPRGTQIIINGVANQFYTNPIDVDNVELENDMGDLVGVKFEIPEPLLTGQPLPVIFGPTGEGFLALFIFGIGDKNAAGTLYWLDGNSPDTQSDTNRLEITPPSEPLVVGVIYDGYPFVWSHSRSFMIQPTIANDGTFSFIARENANSRGVFCRTAICVSPAYIYFLSENADGLYRVQGNGNPQCITNAGFKNFFRNNGKEPEPIKLINGQIVYPPDFVAEEDLRLFSIGDYVIFRFKNTIGEQVALVFSVALDDFVSYDTCVGNMNAFYREELEFSNNVLLATDSTKISKFGDTPGFEPTTECMILPFAFDAGDARTIKEFKEHLVDAENGDDGYKYTFYINNGETQIGPYFVLGDHSHEREQVIKNLQDAEGFGIKAKNITTIYQWTVAAVPKFYEDRFYFSIKGDEIEDRSSDTEDGGDIGEKLWQGVVIKADTFGQDKILNYYDDKNVLRASITINHDGEQTISYSFPQPFISHTIKRTSDDGVNWIPEVEAYVFDKEPEAGLVWEGEFNTHDLTGLIVMKRMAVAYRSLADATIKLTYDDGTFNTYDLPNSNGEYHKEFFFVVAKKWKACKYRIESIADIRLYKRDSEVWMKSFGAPNPFQRFTPFGGISRVTEILI